MSEMWSNVSLLPAECVFAGFGLKLVLNAVSTGANILKGRVCGNEMINLRLSNDKARAESLSSLSLSLSVKTVSLTSCLNVLLVLSRNGAESTRNMQNCLSSGQSTNKTT